MTQIVNKNMNFLTKLLNLSSQTETLTKYQISVQLKSDEPVEMWYWFLWLKPSSDLTMYLTTQHI